MATEWYYAIDGRQSGPVSSRQLKELADRGELTSQDLVWKEGLSDWMPATTVQGLISHPSPPPTPVEAPVVNIAAEPATYAPRHRRRSDARSIVGPILVIIAALPMIAAIFVPWWSLRFQPNEDDADADTGKWIAPWAKLINAPKSQLRQQLKAAETEPAATTETEARERRDSTAFRRRVIADRKWWDARFKSGDESFADQFQNETKKVEDDKKSSLKMTVWGWSTGSGKMALSFGVVVLVLGVVFLAVSSIRNWSWTISFIATVMGILALVFSLIWIFQSPGKDVGKLFTQGVSVGPWLLLGSGGLFFVLGLFDTIFGISFVARRRR